MKILFICHANVCRSFMAQEILKHILPQAEVFSRGMYVDSEIAVPEKVRAFLLKQGLSPVSHQPKQLSAADLETADFVFCMEPEHLDRLCDHYAQYMDKMWLLNDFVYGKETALEDPIGLSGSAFEKQAELLHKTVVACAKKLLQKE